MRIKAPYKINRIKEETRTLTQLFKVTGLKEKDKNIGHRDS
jgi:hypothetical protein